MRTKLVDPRRLAEIAELMEEVPDEATVTESDLLNEALRKLKPQYREIIDRRRNGETFVEIAKALELKPSTVHEQFHIAIERLRDDPLIKGREV